MQLRFGKNNRIARQSGRATRRARTCADILSAAPRHTKLHGILLEMKKPLAQLGAWNRLLDSTVKHNIPTPTASLAHPHAINCAPALIAAFAICGVLGGISLLVPPFINADSGHGFLAWRGTVLGAVNSIIAPDPANISLDTVSLLTYLSPGQYLVPGAISLLGLPLGIAMTLTVALSLLASLVGWVMVVRTFSPRTSLALLVAVLIGSFHYSTHAFSTYHGGEILLQAVTPWLVLTAYRVPEMDVVPAALLVAGAVFFAFMAKLTGLIVLAAALAAGSLVSFAFDRRITRGMIGGALGSLATLVVIYVAFLSRGWTAVSDTNWSLPFENIAFASLAPWVAGMSLADPIELIYFALPKQTLTAITTSSTNPWQPAYLLVVVPAALLVAGLVLFWRSQTTDEQKFKLFCLWFYGVVATVFILLFIHGANIELDERHFRSVGTLLFVCALMSALAAGTPRWTRRLFLVLCALMAFYGVTSFSYHELTTAKGQSLDRASWTNQRIVDAAAIDFAREVYAREGRDALFVLPLYGMAQIAVTLPVDARVLVMNFDLIPEPEIAGRYSGRVPGHVVVLVPNSIFDTGKDRALLAAFADYAPDAWNRKTFANTSVYFQ